MSIANTQTDVILVDGRWVRDNPEPSVTRQEHKAEAEINNIVERFDRTGQLTHVSRLTGQYLDVSSIGSFEQALELARYGESVFSELPSHIRTSFGNNPAAFMDFMATASHEELREMGLTRAPGAPQAPNQASSGDGLPVEPTAPSEPPAASPEA